ncbi:gluconokinase [Loktanella salsilacus]|uniref:gluconokinase n=1 Tax=Loktanella salsilacus TaxID=195913 RepID=UPI00373501FE
MTDAAPLIIVMGVSGCGKSHIGAALAQRLGLGFLDGDSLHPAANIAKMAQGIPLDDDDRAPWLDAVGRALGTGAEVIACSALKRRYRDRIRAAAPGVVFVHLDGARDVLARRVSQRPGHFMPPALLDSQLATLEPLAADETAVVVNLDQTPEQIIAAIISTGQFETA